MATERLDIIVKLNDASKAGTRAVKTNLKGIGVAADQASKSIKALGASLLGITAIFAAGRGFANAVKIFTEFDDAIRQVGAVTNATNEELIALTDTAKELGATTRFSATQAAEGLKFLGLAGFEAAEAIQALPDVLNLAAAGSLELGQAADITTNILAGFGLEVEQLGRVNDVLVKTFTSSNNNLVEIGEAFKLVGPIAKGVGADFEDLLASIGKLGDAGLKASIGGTSLRGTLAALFNPTRQEAKLMEELSDRIGGVGLQIKDSEGDFIGFKSIIQQLEQAALTGDEALKLFGLRAGPGVAALLNQGSEALGTLRDDLKSAGGTADTIATQMEEGIGGATRELIASLEALRIKFIETFGDSIINSIDNIAGAFRRLSGVIEDNRASFELIGNTAVTVMNKIGGAINGAINRMLALGKAIALVGFAFTLTERNQKEGIEVLKEGVQEILDLFRDPIDPVTIPVKVGLKNALDEVKAVAKSDSPIGKGAKKVGKTIEENIVDSKAINESLKAAFVRLSAILETETKKIESDYSKGLINLEQYYSEREAIIKRQLTVETNLLQRKLEQEKDLSKKELIASAIFAKEQQLQQELIQLDKERFDETKKLNRQRENELKKAEQQRLQIAEKAVQADKLINDLRVRNALSTSDELEDVFKNETIKLQERQRQELENFKSLKQDELTTNEFINQQKLEQDKLLENQKRRLKEETDRKFEESEKLLNDLRVQNALITSQRLEDTHSNELLLLEQRQQEELDNFLKFEEDKARIEDFVRQQRLQKDKLLLEQQKQLDQARLDSAQQVFSGLAQLSNDLFTLTGSNSKELFAISQALSIAEATMNTYSAATKALAEGGPFAGPALAAIITAQGLLNVAKISSQSFADGGVVQGHSPHSRADNIQANLTAGEGVLNVPAMRTFGALPMELMNKQAPTDQIIAALSNRGKLTNFSLPKSSRVNFADGGTVTTQSQQTQSGTQEERSLNIINIVDPTEISRYLNTGPGRNDIVNAISSKSQTVKRILAT